MNVSYLSFYIQQLDEYIKQMSSPVESLGIDNLVAMREEAERYIESISMEQKELAHKYYNKIEQAYKQGLETIKQRYNI